MSGLNQFFKTTDPSSATDLNKYMYLRGVDEHSPYVSEEGNPAADAGLPVITPLIDLAKLRTSYGVVWEPATIVAIDPETKKMTVANGGKPYTVTYTKEDAAKGVRKKDQKTVVAVGDTRVFPANKPLGMSFDVQLQSAKCQDNIVLVPEQAHAQVFLKGFVVYPIIFKDVDTKYDFQNGDYVAPDCPSANDLINNPKAKTGGWRIFVEETDATLTESKIKRTANLIVTGKQKDSLGQKVAKVISVIDFTEVPRDRSLYNTTYKSENMVGPETAGLLPAYYLIWKSNFKPNTNAGSPDKVVPADLYKCKLLYTLISDR